MSKTRKYWERGLDMVPEVTGAASVMDCRDLRDAATGLGIPLPITEPLLDVGCGTGRLAGLVAGPSQNYFGTDLSRDAVAYTKEQGYLAKVTTSPLDLPRTHLQGRPFVWGAVLSVFTHIDRPERIAFLLSLSTRVRNVWCDIIPGDGSGDVSCWTANEEQFLSDAKACLWTPVARYARLSPDVRQHLYFWMGRS